MTQETNTTAGKRPDYTNNKDGVAVWVKTNAKGDKQYLSIQLTVLGQKFNLAAFPDDYNEQPT